jgi:endonuclease G
MDARMKISVTIFLLLSYSLAFALERSRPTGKAGQIIHRDGYSIQYNSSCKLPYWVSYHVKASDLIKNVSRTNNFRPDPEIKGAQALLDDYKNSGYDRGHMARAGIFTRNKKVMSESFILSNIVPQDRYMNQNGAWRRVEDFEYDSIKTFGKVAIISGPVLDPNMQTIGPNQVCVPNYVFKVLYKEKPSPSAVAFIIPNFRTSEKFTAYAVSVDDLEKETGLDFLPELEDSIERRVEASFDLNDWKRN